MKLHVIVAAALAAVVASPVALASDSEDQQAMYTETCENYAKEDGVSSEQKAAYIAQCVRDLEGAEAAPDGGSEEKE